MDKNLRNFTDWRALCQELVAKIEYTWGSGIPQDARQLMESVQALLSERGKSCLQWTENRPPGTDGCPYDHCIAETPFGHFLITWKSWKEYDSPTVDETPWGDWYQVFANVDKAKDACEREYIKRLSLQRGSFR